eukprot:6063408-Prymnesium_polylepis.1
MSVPKPGTSMGAQMPPRAPVGKLMRSSTCTMNELFATRASRVMPPGASACLHSVVHRIFLFGVRHEKPPLRTNRPPIESMTVPAPTLALIQMFISFICVLHTSAPKAQSSGPGKIMSKSS